MIAKVRGAVAAAEAGGVPVVIASWADPAALEALASGASVGTRVVPPHRATAAAPSREGALAR
jgi:acetylglutamate kinase